MKKKILDGNSATAYVAYAMSEIFAIYPITPSTPMAELCDKWTSEGKTNLFSKTPKVVEMQSEAGAAGVLHGALTAGALCTTFTASQGLLLMIPEMYKIAGELLPAVFHVSARSISTHALCIFGDHQDVMACRQTGFAMLCSSSVQEAHDFAFLAHLCALQSSIPFLHFFDGFRTSHETTNVDVLEYDEMKGLVDEGAVAHFRNRALTPNAPVCRGTAQNSDVYFQNREACNPYHVAVVEVVKGAMQRFGAATGRAYAPFEYVGAKDAEHVVVMMGSGSATMEETALHLNAQGKKTGVIKVRLYRPFSASDFLSVLPKTCKKIAVLDRTKESGATGEPLYLDVCATLQADEKRKISVIGGRYGLGSKEFNPTCALAVFKNLESESPKHPFTVGIVDDVSHLSLKTDEKLVLPTTDGVEFKFYGLGSDGTVGANKNSVKIVGEHTDLFAQAYFCYDSRKSGGATVSHLRFSKTPIHKPYLVENADFIACHNPSYLTRIDTLDGLKTGGTFLLNCPWTGAELEKNLPTPVKRALAEKKAKLYVANATKLAKDVGLKGRTSVVMQALFFLLNERILPYDKAVFLLKNQLSETFKAKGERVVKANLLAVDKAKDVLEEIAVPTAWATLEERENDADIGENYYRNFIAPILRLEGDKLPVSAFNPDGSYPTGTTKLEKHGAPALLPKWIKSNCIQCNQCAFVCPHACIRPFLFSSDVKIGARFDGLPALGVKGHEFRIQVSPLDCMGCSVCANACPTKEKALVMTPTDEIFDVEKENWEIAEKLPRVDVSQKFKRDGVKGSQFFPPLFEFSYACAGCGETPYIKVLTQLFGEKIVVANATGCSSIYGASAPTCPYAKNENGQGPAWASSLFEDNAEFGLGMRLAYDFKGENPSVWIIGGDGWAYDIGYGGLDHVLSLGEKVRILVLDSEVYSNTGGQSSKATPTGASVRFATGGKRRAKKNLGLMAMCYGNVYVAQVSMGADKAQFLRALTEAENFSGTALIIAYSPCIAHGVSLENCMQEEKRAVDSGHFPLFRFNPDLKKQGKNPFLLDSKAPDGSLSDFYDGEGRFSILQKTRPAEADALKKQAEESINERYALYEKLAKGEFTPN